MGKMDVKNKKLLYHLTKLKNLDSILENGLLSRKLISDLNLKFGDVADQEIISKRTELGLDLYTPFHFHPYSSFDNAVKNRYKDDDFIYICILREAARYNNFKILPIHPLSLEHCQLLDYDEGFERIDWESMETYGTEESHIKHVKMAECLTELIIPVELFHCIFVKDEKIQKIVKDKYEEKSISPPHVSIQSWF